MTTRPLETAPVSVSSGRVRRLGQQRGRGGRPHKGPRDAMMIRPHEEIGRVVRARAAEAGYSVTGYVSALLANEVGLPHLAPAPDGPPAEKQREELPLTG